MMQRLLFAASVIALLSTPFLIAQDRDMGAERMVLDDDGNDGTLHTLTIDPDDLGQNTTLIIPDPGSSSATLLLIGAGSSSPAWLLGGNSNATTAGDFLGTTNANPMRIVVNGGTDNSMILNTNGSIQRRPVGLLRGTNAVDLQVAGPFFQPHYVASGSHAVIGGGQNNRASGSHSTAAGGYLNAAHGHRSAVGGGYLNEATGTESIVGGGLQNVASGVRAVVAGGSYNSSSGFAAVVSGGSSNGALADYSVVGGGQNNAASANYSVVGGGQSNAARGTNSTVSGGNANNTNASAQYAAIGGGRQNVINDVNDAVIGGGMRNTNEGFESVIGGGHTNSIFSRRSAIPGGTGLTLAAGSDGSFGFLANTATTPANDMTVAAQHVAVFGNTDLWLANNDNAASQLRFYEANATTGTFPTATSFYTSFEAGDQTTDINYILPTTTTETTTVEDGVLQHDAGTGQLSWVDPTVAANAWNLDGNAGTTPGTDFVGTSDAQALHILVNGGTDNSLILNTNGSIQRDAGGDARGSNAVDLQIVRGVAAQVASGAEATIGGGLANRASGNWATVGGGLGNVASGLRAAVGGGIYNLASDDLSTIGGGGGNTASASGATVGGGDGNSAQGIRATIGGGGGNTASGLEAAVGGGRINNASGNRATIGGGINNLAVGDQATIGGGSSNYAPGFSSTIGGGGFNTVSGLNSAIPGGRGLTISGDGSFGFLGGNPTGANDMTTTASDIALFGNTDLWLANNDNAASQIRFYEAYGTPGAFPNGTNFTSFEAGAQSADINYILPTVAPTVGQVLQASVVAGSTVTLAWAADATGTAPAGGGASSIAMPEEGGDYVMISRAELASILERIKMLERRQESERTSEASVDRSVPEGR